MFIYLCEVAWELYDKHLWKQLDEHRKICKDCYTKEIEK